MDEMDHMDKESNEGYGKKHMDEMDMMKDEPVYEISLEDEMALEEMEDMEMDVEELNELEMEKEMEKAEDLYKVTSHEPNQIFKTPNVHKASADNIGGTIMKAIDRLNT